jgi:hypothetical protein
MAFEVMDSVGTSLTLGELPFMRYSGSSIGSARSDRIPAFIRKSSGLTARRANVLKRKSRIDDGDAE